MLNYRLKNALEIAKLHYDDVAQELGVDPKTVHRWIYNGRVPYKRNRSRLAAILGEAEGYLWPDTAVGSSNEVMRMELVSVYAQSEAVSTQVWDSLVDQTRTNIDLMAGSTQLLLQQIPRFIRIVSRLRNRDVQIKMLVADPLGGGAWASKPPEASVDTDDSIEPFLTLAPNLDVRLHRLIVGSSIFRFDDQMMVVSHFPGRMATQSPVLYFRRLAQDGLFDHYSDTFQHIWVDHSTAPRR